MEAVCGGRSVAQKPGGGTSDRGAGVQRGHASYVGATGAIVTAPLFFGVGMWKSFQTEKKNIFAYIWTISD